MVCVCYSRPQPHYNAPIRFVECDILFIIYEYYFEYKTGILLLLYTYSIQQPPHRTVYISRVTILTYALRKETDKML